MSKSYLLSCDDCKESIWIGQGWGPESSHDFLYDHGRKGRKRLLAWLHRHEDHALAFHQDCDGGARDRCGYSRVEIYFEKDKS